MAAPAFLISVLLIASGAFAIGDDGARELPHLELPATPGPDSGPAHWFDTLLELPRTPREHGYDAFLELPGTHRAHGSDAPPPQGLMDIMSIRGCGAFAGLVAATPNASDVFQQLLVAGGGGLTVFCPDDKAITAFVPAFLTLDAKDRLDVLLHHGVVPRYGRKQLAVFDWVALRTLAAADATTNKSQSITVRDDVDTVWLWPSRAPCQSVPARVIKTISPEEGPLAVYLVDAVLLPGHLRQKLYGGYLDFDWIHCCIPVWVMLLCAVVIVVGGVASGRAPGSRMR